MDITNLISVYGEAEIVPCAQCNTQGCTVCSNIGYIAKTTSGYEYTYTYPLYVALQERTKIIFTKNAILISASIILIFCIIISYILNITHG